MRKRLMFIFLLMALVLGACQAQSATPSIEAYATEPAASGATNTPLANAAAPATQAPSEGQTVVAECTVVSPRPTPGPTEQSYFPLPGEEDQVIGPADAYVTFIEYSDFQ